jgi:hypothetical protein
MHWRRGDIVAAIVYTHDSMSQLACYARRMTESSIVDQNHMHATPAAAAAGTYCCDLVVQVLLLLGMGCLAAALP